MKKKVLNKDDKAKRTNEFFTELVAPLNKTGKQIRILGGLSNFPQSGTVE
ncbi:MAG: hypothetical protein HY507_01345, partial [Candidatus Zambryskibacteria bacterium]|nr:hypothetical protein [Candidatus Zambryskibacteria bacterium]